MNRLIIYYLVLLSFFYSQDKNFDISNILVSGNIEMSEQDIINFSGLSPNSSVNAIDINNAINRLWLLNRFENIQIDFIFHLACIASPKIYQNNSLQTFGYYWGNSNSQT